MAGVPARQIGWVCECGRRLNTTLQCECGDADETIDGVVEDFLFVRGSHLSLKICRKGKAIFCF